jgi:polyribonucleotide nucleotidyltransferase
MIPKVFKEVIDLGDGRQISIETGKLAKQAHGSVVVQSGNCMLLCTVVSNYKQSDVDFLPLTVDYREKFAAAGRYPGGFFKREGRPTVKEILVSRLTDRPIRPLFPEGFRNEVQIIPTTVSADQINPPDILAIIGASAALTVSDIPFNGPIGAVRVGKINGELIVNDNFETSISFGFSSTREGAEKIVSVDDPEINYKYK